MAEERLIDTDKDKKYRIRKNADGEDELFIDESVDEEQTEEVTFMVEDEANEAEEPSFSDYSQIEEETKQRTEEAAELIQNARKDCDEERFATAADYLEKAIELDPENGEIYALELVAYTRNFTDFSRVKDAREYIDELKRYTSKQTKEELFAKSSEVLEANIDSLKKSVTELDEENSRQKAIRAKKFVADRSRAISFTVIVLALLFVFAALSIYYFVNIHSVQNNTNLIMAIIFAALAFIALVFTAFILRRLLTACRRVRLNKKNTATKLGRELLAKQADLDAFTAIYEALKG
ncbi:MAG: cysteine-rich outer membrane protein [Candidatus Coproplasma sp.]